MHPHRTVAASLGVALTLALPLIVSSVPGCRRTFTTTPQVIAMQWVDAWNARDRGALLSLFDEDAIFWWPTMNLPVRGKKAIDAQLKTLWGGWAEVEMHRNDLFLDVAGEKIAIDWTLAFRDTRTGRPVRLAGVDMLQVHNGLVTGERGIFNTCDLLQQLQPPSPAPAAPVRPLLPRAVPPGPPTPPSAAPFAPAQPAVPTSPAPRP